MKSKNAQGPQRSAINQPQKGVKKTLFGLKKTPKSLRHKTSETVKAILIALFAALVLRQFVIASYNVPTGSMKDTIMIGDFMFVNKFIYGARSPIWIGIPFFDFQGYYLPEWLQFQAPAITDPDVNDIVVFDYPKERKTDYIKRCVAKEGQVVEMIDGSLFVNGQPEGVKEPLYRKFDPEDGTMVTYTKVSTARGKSYNIRHFTNIDRRHIYDGQRWEIPDNSYFMMGDNRDNSQDSRFWGFVPRSHVVGKPLMTWMSWNSNVPGYRFYDKIRWSRLGKVLWLNK